MKKTQWLFLLISLMLAVLLTGCVDVSTEMTVDKSFSGKRIMTLSFDPETVEERLENGLEDVDRLLEKAKPEQLSFYRSDSVSPAEYVFTLEFSSLEDYKSKVKAIIGRDVSVEFSCIDDTFSRDICLVEDFDSTELFGWAEDIITTSSVYKDVVADLAASENSETANQPLFTCLGSKLNIGSSTVSVSAGKIEYRSGNGDVVTNIDITTLLKEDGTYQRYVTFLLDPSLGGEAASGIMSYMSEHKPNGAQFSQSSDPEKFSCTISFTADSEGELAKGTSAIFGNSSSVSFSGYEDASRPLTELEAFNESFDLSKFTTDEVLTLNYKIISEKGVPSELFDVSANEAVKLETENGGNSIAYVGEGSEFSFRTVMESISRADCIQYSLVLNDDDSFTREIKIFMSAGTDPEVLSQIARYYEAFGAANTSITTTTGSKMPYVCITITGTASQVCNAENVLFGVYTERSISYERDGGLFKVKPNSKLVDCFDISSMLSLTGTSLYVYSVKTDDQVYQVSSVINGEVVSQSIEPTDAPITQTLSNGAQQITFDAKYVNAGAIIFICLIIVLMLLLIALAVTLYISSKTEEDDDSDKVEELPSAEEDTKALPEANVRSMEEIMSEPEETPIVESFEVNTYPDSDAQEEAAKYEAEDDFLGIFSGADLGEEEIKSVEDEFAFESETETEAVELEPEPEIAEPEVEASAEPEQEKVIEVPAPQPIEEKKPEIDPYADYVDRFPMEDLPPMVESPNNKMDEYSNKDFIEDLKYLGYLDEYKKHVSRVRVKVKKKSGGKK